MKLGLSSLVGIGEEPPKGKKLTQQQMDAANMEAKRFGMARGLLPGVNMYAVSSPYDALPKYVDPAGKDYVPMPTKPLPTSVPDYITLNDIKSQEGKYWYNDPYTGDIVDIDPIVLTQKRFKPNK